MELYCCGCEAKVEARLIDGSEAYPHRPDLKPLPFWKCDACGNFVGCHHKTSNRTNPLGHIPTPELKQARKHIHAILDPLWKSGGMKRKTIYAILTEKLGWAYHTAMIRDIEEARQVYRLVRDIKSPS
jgi:hypothetical protein